MSGEQDGQRAAVKIRSASPDADSSALMPSRIEVKNESAVGIRREATTGSVIVFPRPKVATDYEAQNPEIVGDQTVKIVTGDYSTTKPKNANTSRRKNAQVRPGEKPRIPGCEVVIHGAGWNVFRYWYNPKKPTERWPKKNRAYECYLTKSDIEEGKELESNGKKKTQRRNRKS